jgi:hypothetical protein
LLEIVGSAHQRVAAIEAGPVVIPLHIRGGAQGPPDRVTVLDVSLNGDKPDATSRLFSFELKPASSILEATFNPTPLTAAGTYTVALLLEGEAKDGKPLRQLLSLDFSVPAAELHLANPLRLEQVHLAPCIADLSPHHWFLTESSTKARLASIQVRTLGQLEGPDDHPLAARLHVEPPQSLEPLGSAPAKVSIDGHLPLGRTTGSLLVYSPQLAAPLTVAVEIVSRVARGWLLVVILLGILAGLVLRVKLEEQSARLRAEETAQEQLGRLSKLAADQRDERLRAAIAAAAEGVRRAILDGAAPDKLGTAVTAAVQAIEQLMQEAKQKRDALALRIADLHKKLGPVSAQPPPVRKAIEAVRERLNRQQAALAGGEIESVDGALTTEESEIDATLREPITAWSSEVGENLKGAGAWSGTSFEAARANVATQIDALSSIQAWHDLVAKLPQVTIDLRQRVMRVGVQGLCELGENVLAALVELEDDKLEPDLKQLKAALDEASAWMRGAPDADQTSRMAQILRTLRSRLVNSLKSAAGTVSNDVLSKLESGSFEEATRLVLDQRPKDRMLSRGEKAQPSASWSWRMLRGERGTEADRPGTREAAAPMTIVAAGNPTVGQPVALAVGIDTMRPETSVQWFVEGRLVAEGAAGSKSWTFTPQRPGQVIVQARIVDPGSIEQAEGSLLLDVRPAEGYAALPALQKQIWWNEMKTTIVSGVFIAAGGYLIFRTSFLGTFEDFFAAFLWGFSVDIGVARVKEMANPLLTRTLPAPKNSSS